MASPRHSFSEGITGKSTSSSWNEIEMYSTKTIHKNINPNYQQTYTSIGDPYKGTTEAVPSRWKSKQLSTTSFPQNASNGFFQKLSYDPGKSACIIRLSLLESSSNSSPYFVHCSMQMEITLLAHSKICQKSDHPHRIQVQLPLKCRHRLS